MGGEAAATLPLGPVVTFDTLVRLLDSYSRAVDSLAFVFGHQVRCQGRRRLLLRRGQANLWGTQALGVLRECATQRRGDELRGLLLDLFGRLVLAVPELRQAVASVLSMVDSQAWLYKPAPERQRVTALLRVADRVDSCADSR